MDQALDNQGLIQVRVAHLKCRVLAGSLAKGAWNFRCSSTCHGYKWTRHTVNSSHGELVTKVKKRDSELVTCDEFTVW